MGEIRQIALDLQQDIATSDDPGCVARRLAGRGETEIEEILSLEIDGRTVFQAIASHDRANVLEKILSCGVNINRVDRYAVHVAISQKAVNVMKILLAHKASIDMITEDGKTPLHIASELGYVKIVRELLDNGAKPMLNLLEKTGCTPLTLACMTDHRETATCLMIYGAAVNFDGAFPPLHASALMGYVDLVRMLLDRGAYVNLQDMKLETPLHYAAYKSHMPIVQLLLQRGALSYVDARGKTPIDLATDEDIKALLKDKLKTKSPGRIKSKRTSGPKRSPPIVDEKPADLNNDDTKQTINGVVDAAHNEEENQLDNFMHDKPARAGGARKSSGEQRVSTTNRTEKEPRNENHHNNSEQQTELVHNTAAEEQETNESERTSPRAENSTSDEKNGGHQDTDGHPKHGNAAVNESKNVVSTGKQTSKGSKKKKDGCLIV